MKSFLSLLLACAAPLALTGCGANPAQMQDAQETAYSGSLVAPTFYSETLHLDWNYTAYLPESYDAQDDTQRFPVMYLMHGAYGNHRNLVERFSTKAIMDRLIGEGVLPEMVVVFIDGFNSFYVNGPAFQMETAVINDLIPYMEKTYHGAGTKEGRIIGGISMGGYGTARFALKYPQLFSNALMLSPAVWYEIREGQACTDWCLFDGFAQKSWDREHPAAYMDAYVSAKSPVDFYIYHGEADAAVPRADVDRFAKELSAIANVHYELAQWRGHDWGTWEVFLNQALEKLGASYSF